MATSKTPDESAPTGLSSTPASSSSGKTNKSGTEQSSAPQQSSTPDTTQTDAGAGLSQAQVAAAEGAGASKFQSRPETEGKPGDPIGTGGSAGGPLSEPASQGGGGTAVPPEPEGK